MNDHHSILIGLNGLQQRENYLGLSEAAGTYPIARPSKGGPRRGRHEADEDK
jgi:hypothetical protein